MGWYDEPRTKEGQKARQALGKIWADSAEKNRIARQNGKPTVEPKSDISSADLGLRVPKKG